ncbi:MarR family winged helix-turn-helix transcriptional regulator [Poseidonocella sp. HB161398]|uniref:MarR family winged helix-turn-helix transcriptional regulator n=1 Tax=Poseidonocella sp. HB161398 TaxID=2320855 RepID=UPI001108F340|nr:MarR family transcriptional regulator [Poseidonocella sp. HB161398]
MADPEDLELAERMRAATGAFVRRTRQAAGTPSDARIDTLGHLDRSPRLLSAAMLARLRGVAHQSMRTLLAEMAESGLVAGTRDPGDARAVLFAVTAAGRALLAQSRAARSAWLAERWIAGMSAEEKAALRQVIDAMARLGDPG